MKGKSSEVRVTSSLMLHSCSFNLKNQIRFYVEIESKFLQRAVPEDLNLVEDRFYIENIREIAQCDIGELCQGSWQRLVLKTPYKVSKITCSVKSNPCHLFVDNSTRTDQQFPKMKWFDSLFIQLLKVNSSINQHIRALWEVHILPIQLESIKKTKNVFFSTYFRLNRKLNCQVHTGAGVAPFALLRVMPTWISLRMSALLFMYLYPASVWLISLLLDKLNV